MSTPIYYIKNGTLSFADKVVFEDIELYLYPGEKVCLIGRNGCGKSSLMKVISGDYELDKGDIYRDPISHIEYLKQDTKIDSSGSVYDLIKKDLNNDGDEYKADIIFNKLHIDGNWLLKNLSGGQIRRVLLAKTLIDQPEILLLDEPTNHLDIIAIEWLEEYIKSYPGAVVCISHDRAFLTNVTNKLWWLDRGVIRKSDQGFAHFDSWRQQLLEHEEATLRKLNKKLEEENLWLSQGVTARRKRNQKRLGDLIRLRQTMKDQNTHHKSALAKIDPIMDSEDRKSKFIIEANNISFSYEGKKIITDFSFRVKKGEIIGVIGPNGSGKSTILKLLLKELIPDDGIVKHGTNLEISYFDQHRSSLNPNHSIKQTLCPTGGDQVFLPNDQTMHVAGYMKNFMFDPKLLNAKVSTLSGGESNRLLLAKTLINPGNLLVLDEPTNDLDMDSLEILLEILGEYNGTVILVSHDRDFLERLVTRSLIFNEQGKIIDIVGGYNDYLKTNPKISDAPKEQIKTKKVTKLLENKIPSNKLSYKDQRLLEIIPGQIKDLESSIKQIEQELSSPTLYQKNPKKFNELSHSLTTAKAKIEELTDQWLSLS